MHLTASSWSLDMFLIDLGNMLRARLMALLNKTAKILSGWRGEEIRLELSSPQPALESHESP